MHFDGGMSSGGGGGGEMGWWWECLGSVGEGRRNLEGGAGGFVVVAVRMRLSISRECVGGAGKGSYDTLLFLCCEVDFARKACLKDAFCSVSIFEKTSLQDKRRFCETSH